MEPVTSFVTSLSKRSGGSQLPRFGERIQHPPPRPPARDRRGGGGGGARGRGGAPRAARGGGGRGGGGPPAAARRAATTPGLRYGRFSGPLMSVDYPLSVATQKFWEAGIIARMSVDRRLPTRTARSPWGQ
ncbi:MAG: hypothetical protein F4062_01535 [Acidimicrobiia bacterium]|nr:hypothetical protein [Acidimicrobiia bacterium]